MQLLDFQLVDVYCARTPGLLTFFDQWSISQESFFDVVLAAVPLMTILLLPHQYHSTYFKSVYTFSSTKSCEYYPPVLWSMVSIHSWRGIRPGIEIFSWGSIKEPHSLILHGHLFTGVVVRVLVHAKRHQNC